jgi:hypothetical protein
MKKLILITFSLLFTITAAQAQPASTKSIKQLMDKTGAGQMGMQAMRQMLPSLKRMVPNAPEKFWTDFMAEVSPDDLVNMVIPIYQKYLTEEDVQAINRFYDSPAGRKLIQSQPMIMRESMLQGQAWGQKLARKVIDRYKAEQQAQGGGQ